MPDLLFDDIREERIDDIRLFLDSPHAIGEDAPLHRVTVFLTYRCNLACPYCKTIARTQEELRARPQKGVTFCFEDFRAMLLSHGRTPIRHLHFTGGEAALIRELPAMIRLAKERGVECVSITSNGTLPPQTYLEMLAAGMDEIRISLDAADAALGKALTQRDNAWVAASKTIRALSAERRSGAKFFLIVNTVVSAANRVQLPAILEYLLGLGPDDIKLITDVDAKAILADFPEASEVRQRLAALLKTQPQDSFPLLRLKLKTVFSPAAIGLETTAPKKDGSWRCYIPLTERTVDGVFYYPCSVYLREGGAPLGKTSEPQELQRAKSADFVARGDCLTDPICARYCLHCTKNYNVRANEERGGH